MQEKRKYNNMNSTRISKKILLIGFLNILIALGFGRFLFPLAVSFFNNFYRFSFTQIGTLASLILLGYLVFSYIGGLALYKFGYRILIITALEVLAIAFFLYFTVSNFYLLCFSSFLMGCCSAAIYISIFPISFDSFPTKAYGKNMGFMLSGAGLGILAISVFSEFVLQNKSTAFYIWGLAALLTLLISLLNFFFLPNSKPRFASNRNANKVQQITAQWGKLFTVPLLRNITLAYFFYGFAYASYLNYVLAYATDINYAYSVNLIWICFGSCSIISAILWGLLADNNNKKLKFVLFGNYVLTGIAIILPLVIPKLLYLYFSVSLFGLCFFGYITIVGGIVVKATQELSSVYMGKITLIHTIAQILSVFTGGVLRDYTGNFKLVFIFSFTSLLVSIFFFILYFLNLIKGVRGFEKYYSYN